MRVLSKDTGGPRTLQATFATMCVGKTLNLKGSGYPIRAARTTTGRLDAAFSGWTCSGNGINPAAVILCLVCGLGGPGEKSAFRKLAGRFCELCVDTQSSQCRWGFDSSDRPLPCHPFEKKLTCRASEVVEAVEDPSTFFAALCDACLGALSTPP